MDLKQINSIDYSNTLEEHDYYNIQTILKKARIIKSIDEIKEIVKPIKNGNIKKCINKYCKDKGYRLI